MTMLAQSRLMVTAALSLLLLGSALPCLGQAASFLPQSAGYSEGGYYDATRSVAPGVEQRFVALPEGPLTYHAVTIDLTTAGLRPMIVKGRDLATGRERVDEMAARLRSRGWVPVVGINADFWGAQALPVGWHVEDGTLWSGPGGTRSVLAFDDEDRPLIASGEGAVELLSPTGGSLVVDDVNGRKPGQYPSLRTTPSGTRTPLLLDDGIREAILELEAPKIIPNTAVPVTMLGWGHGESDLLPTQAVLLLEANKIPSWLQPGAGLTLSIRFDKIQGSFSKVTGGGPRILEHSVFVGLEAGERESVGQEFVRALHPRSAIGISADRTKLVLLTVDGRQPGRSIGADLELLADLMAQLGCADALNMDGGGSSTLWVRDGVANFPSDPAGPRPVTNALFFVRPSEPGPPHRIEFDATNLVVPPAHLLALGGAVSPGSRALPVGVKAYDRQGGEVPFPSSSLQWWINRDPDGDPAKRAPISRGAIVQSPQAPGSFTIGAGTADGSLSVEQRVLIEEAATLLPSVAAVLMQPGDKTDLRWTAQSTSGRHFVSHFSWLHVEVPPFLTYDPVTGTLRATGEGEGFITGSVGTRSVRIPVASGSARRASLINCDGLPALRPDEWLEGLRNDKAATTMVLDAEVKRQGAAAWRCTYKFMPGGTSRLTLPVNLPIPQDALAVELWVRCDVLKPWIRGTLKDRNGNGYYLDFTAAAGVPQKGTWTRLQAPLRNLPRVTVTATAPEPPYTMANLYLVQPDETKKGYGVIWLDDMAALMLPDSLIEPSATAAVAAQPH